MTSATRRAITLFEVLITTVVVLVAVAIIVPSLSHKRTQQIMAKNATQMRDIHQAMVTYSQGNKFWFPGATNTGKVDANAAISDRHGSIMRLQSDEYFEADLNISPAELDEQVASEGLRSEGVNQRGSYAVLEYAINGIGSNLSTLGIREWRDQLNTSAIIVSDRQMGKPGEPRSLWARNSDECKGHVVFGDNHVQFELSDGPFGGKYGQNKGSGTGTIGFLFECCDGKKADGRMVAD
jgi:type II secretory pathway pseudopilin PulG